MRPFLLAALLFLVTACGTADELSTVTPTQPGNSTGVDVGTTDPGKPVQRIVDGDTLVLETGERIRLYAIDAPEVGDLGATEATTRLRQLSGDAVLLVTHGEDRFGRTLACVYTLDGTSIDNTLIDEGLVEIWVGASCDDEY